MCERKHVNTYIKACVHTICTYKYKYKFIYKYCSNACIHGRTYMAVNRMMGVFVCVCVNVYVCVCEAEREKIERESVPVFRYSAMYA